MVLGDSLSAAYNIPSEKGWVALLDQQMESTDCPGEVVNASISGETSFGGLSRLPDLLQRHQPSIVILELGGNDGLRGMSVTQLYQNLRDIAVKSADAGARVVLAGIQIPTNYGARYTREFAAAYPRLAEELGLPLIPFLLEGVALEPELLQADGIHPTADAQPVILDNVLPVLAPMLDGCLPETFTKQTFTNQ